MLESVNNGSDPENLLSLPFFPFLGSIMSISNDDDLVQRIYNEQHDVLVNVMKEYTRLPLLQYVCGSLFAVSWMVMLHRFLSTNIDHRVFDWKNAMAEMKYVSRMVHAFYRDLSVLL